jgi:hypothetical protein
LKTRAAKSGKPQSVDELIAALEASYPCQALKYGGDGGTRSAVCSGHTQIAHSGRSSSSSSSAASEEPVNRLIDFPAALFKLRAKDKAPRVVESLTYDAAFIQEDTADCEFDGLQRSELIDALFQRLDVDCNHRLRWDELRPFLSKLWQSEGPLSTKAYVQLCRELSVAPQEGLDRHCFAAVVDERVESGWHCTNAELAGFLASTLQHNPFAWQGKEKVQAPPFERQVR